MSKKDNILYFFLLALVFHLSLFIVRERGVKGDAPVSLKSNSAPISVKIKSPIIRKEAVVVKKEVTPPTPKEEKKPEPKKIEPPKKDIIKPDIKSKIKDKKKKVEKKKIEEKKAEPIPPKTTPNTEKIPSTPTAEQEILASGNFSIGKDGIFTAASSEGIEYKILKQVDPDYPVQAERIRYKKKVVITARFLVGLKGEVEKINIINSHEKFGFDKEVEKALKQWKFHPIYYKNKNIKVYFTKDFIFEPK